MSILMARFMCLHFHMHKEGILEHTIPSNPICVHFSKVNIVYHRNAPYNIIEHTHAKMSISALERQVS